MRAERAAAWSAQLAEVHDRLRDQLAALRAGAVPPGSLLEHCLAFCTAIRTHHEGEDAGLFADLTVEHPDLTPDIAKLVDDHRAVAGIVAGIRAAVERGGASEADLDGLAAILDSHFRYEERALAGALAGRSDERGWAREVFHPDGADGPA